MKLTHLGHSCVLVDVGSERILIDPGNLSDEWHGLRDLSGILVTHQHPDHADPVELPRLIAENPGARVVVEPTVFEVVDLPDHALSFRLGEVVDFGQVRVETVGGRHAVIHADYPRIGNMGLIVRSSGEPTFFHPGDALEVAPAGIDVVGIPAFGPWAATKETVDFVRAVKARQGFFIHDRLLTPVGLEIVRKHIINLAGETALVEAVHSWEPEAA